MLQLATIWAFSVTGNWMFYVQFLSLDRRWSSPATAEVGILVRSPLLALLAHRNQPSASLSDYPVSLSDTVSELCGILSRAHEGTATCNSVWAVYMNLACSRSGKKEGARRMIWADILHTRSADGIPNFFLPSAIPRQHTLIMQVCSDVDPMDLWAQHSGQKQYSILLAFCHKLRNSHQDTAEEYSLVRKPER